MADTTWPGQALRNRYGTPGRLGAIDTGDLLRRHGLREQLHPRDCAAFRYPTQDAAEAFAAANRLMDSNTVHGPYRHNGRIESVIDFRAQLADLDPPCPATDPALPDDWKPEASRD